MNSRKMVLTEAAKSAFSGSHALLENMFYFSYSRLPLPLRSLARQMRQFVPFCLGARVPVAWLHGPAAPSGKPASLLVAGDEPWIDFLPRRFFIEPPKRTPICRASIRSLPGLVEELRSSADLTIVRVDPVTAGLVFRRGYLRVPEWVSAELTLPQSAAMLTRGKKNLRKTVKRICNRGFGYSVSRRRTDFDFFYHHMHVPYIGSRHGDLASILPPTYLRAWFRQGGILFVEQGGVQVAGLLFVRHQKTLRFLALGAIEGRSDPVREGAFTAGYVFLLQHAHALGCTRVHFGTSRSVLQDGVLRYKARWGVTLCLNPLPGFQLMIHWNRLDGAVADFFAHTSLVFCEADGLSAIHALAADASSVSDAYKALWIKGLRRLFVFGPDARSPVEVLAHPELAPVSPAAKPDFFCQAPRRRSRCF